MEKCVVVIQLRVVRRPLIGVNLIADCGAAIGTGDFPPTLIQFLERQKLTGKAGGFHPIHILGKIAHLIKRGPHRKLQFPLGGSGTKLHSDVDEMVSGMDERNRVDHR